jgi:hypothetical protein
MKPKGLPPNFQTLRTHFTSYLKVAQKLFQRQVGVLKRIALQNFRSTPNCLFHPTSMFISFCLSKDNPN